MTNLTRDVLTTGEVATICRVSPRTVAMWLDSGVLRGWRLPVSADRRVSRAVLEKFMADSGMPAEWLPAKTA